MGKTPAITEFFKRKNGEISTNEARRPLTNTPIDTENNETTPLDESRSTKVMRSLKPSTNSYRVERDPGKREQICQYPVGKQNEIRQAYILKGPYQPVSDSHGRRFQASWYDKFRSWLEYSPEKDAAFCFPCFLFNKPESNKAFIIDGFKDWKHATGKGGAFIVHVGTAPNSSHQNAEKQLQDFLHQERHLANIYAKQTPIDIAKNRLWLAMQGLAMRGRDESENSSNRENFLELIKHQTSFNKDVANAVLNKAPRHASYISSDIQKEILQIFGEKIKRTIREEIGGYPFCIIVDEAGDVSGKQQMAIILKFVNNLGLVNERFFSIVHVDDTCAMTLKKGIFEVLSHCQFDLKNLRGQGYDGTSNMSGKWKGLQALVNEQCPYAYFVHCFAHRLQLALVAAAKDVIPIFQFFSKLSFVVVNYILASYKRVNELQKAYSNEIKMLIEDGELETGIGLNQASNLQRPGDTRWSSHLMSISSLMKMFSATCSIFHKLIDEGDTSVERAQATTALDTMTSFEFIFLLHLMKKVLELSNLLSQALQRKSQDIINSLHLVETTRTLLLKGGRARRQHDQNTVEVHYRRNLFYAAIDVQLQELRYRFNEKSVELLTLSCALEPRSSGQYFKIDDICNLVNKFYPEDFTDVEKEELKVQLCHYEVELSRHEDLKKLSTISELSQWLVNTGKHNMYALIFRLTRLLLTLSVSTASAKRAFSARNVVKTTKRNKMEADFFESCLLINIEREIAKNISTSSIIDTFKDLKERRALL
ncbi:hypothetical protein RND81_13G210600 [Saponaria officinalis]|uniref:TTF-type domain-containing protein n=1 Tax=Saponaria officinalis TaxID=3572 RepID=A0AAW1H0H1_SAPOF